MNLNEFNSKNEDSMEKIKQSLQNKIQFLGKGMAFLNKKRNENQGLVVGENKLEIIKIGILLSNHFKEQNLKMKLKELSCLAMESEPSNQSLVFKASYNNMIIDINKLQRYFCEIDMAFERNEKIPKKLLLNAGINYFDIQPLVVIKDSVDQAIGGTFNNQCNQTNILSFEESQTQTSVQKLISTNQLPSVQKIYKMKISNECQTSKSLMKMHKPALDWFECQLNFQRRKRRHLNFEHLQLNLQNINPCIKVNNEVQYDISGQKVNHLAKERCSPKHKITQQAISLEKSTSQVIDLEKEDEKEIGLNKDIEELQVTSKIINKKKKKVKPTKAKDKIISSEIYNDVHHVPQIVQENPKEILFIISKSGISNLKENKNEGKKRDLNNSKNVSKFVDQPNEGKAVNQDYTTKKKDQH